MIKKVVGAMIAVGLVLSCSPSFSANCIDCHKSMDKVAEKIKKTGVKSADELVDFLRNKSSKKTLHRVVQNEDIKKAFLDVKENIGTSQTPKRGSQSSKKKVEGC
jgi:DNA-binding ferritin-like protein